MKTGRLSHAYIFFGPKGIGKSIAAVNFAKALNCADAVDCEPCGTCPSCKKIDSFSHPDISVVKAERLGKAISIEDIRALIKDIYLKPFEARKKVYIIDGANDMRHEAANALLKTLEEPPADSMLILITEKIEALFHTIVSRCQIVRFFPLNTKEIEAILTKEHSLDEKDAHILAHLSGGSLGEALVFKDEDIFSKRDSLLRNISSPKAAGVDFDNVKKEDFRLYLDILLSWYRDILNTKAGAEERMLVNIDKKDTIFKKAKEMSFEYLEGIINDIMATFLYMDQNVNQKLAMGVLEPKIK